jgi:hypothetical protein
MAIERVEGPSGTVICPAARNGTDDPMRWKVLFSDVFRLHADMVRHDLRRLVISLDPEREPFPDPAFSPPPLPLQA